MSENNLFLKSLMVASLVPLVGPTTWAHINDDVNYHNTRYSADQFLQYCTVEDSVGIFNYKDYDLYWRSGFDWNNDRNLKLNVTSGTFRFLFLYPNKHETFRDYDLDGLVDFISVSGSYHSDSSSSVYLRRVDDYSEYKSIFDNADRELAEFKSKHYGGCSGFGE